MNVKSTQKQTMTAVIIRANGKRENLGTIVGGNFFQKVASYIRIKIANGNNGKNK